MARHADARLCMSGECTTNKIDRAMKHIRIFAILFMISFGCKPLAESQTTNAGKPRQETPPIPSSVSAARRTPIVVVAHNTLPAVVNIQTESTIRRREVDPLFDPFGFFQ